MYPSYVLTTYLVSTRFRQLPNREPRFFFVTGMAKYGLTMPIYAYRSGSGCYGIPKSQSPKHHVPLMGGEGGAQKS